MCQESRHQARSKSGCRYIILLRTLGNDPFGALFGLFHKRRQRTVREYPRHRLQQNECSFIVASSLGMNEHARWCISFGCARTVSVRWGSAAAACPRWLRRCVACCSCQLLILLLKGLVLVSGVFCSGCCGSTPSIVCSYAGYVGACDWRVTPWPMQMRRLGMIGGAFLQNCMRAFLGTCLSIN